ncbi:MAG TPA: NTP transferase domain-containing protein [Vicinamibacterales bacterium]|nr:NTP transferase domain-containing protein [Vicinamibacterales bacterium]
MSHDDAAAGAGPVDGQRARHDRTVTSAIAEAIVLAAGNGDRFSGGTGTSKLVEPVRGVPLIARTLDAAWRAGIARADVVLGYRATEVREAIERHAPAGLGLRFVHNPHWHEENGLSVLAAGRREPGRRFALLMGDHLFAPALLRRLLLAPAGSEAVLLGVDTRPAPPEVAAEATRVRLREGRVVAIAKGLVPYDALDTGLFVCTPALFDAIEESCRAGDTTLTGGVRRLAAHDLVRGIDIGDELWWDVDTPADLRVAEALLETTPA